MRFEEILRALADIIEQHGTGEDNTVQPDAAGAVPAIPSVILTVVPVGA